MLLVVGFSAPSVLFGNRMPSSLSPHPQKKFWCAEIQLVNSANVSRYGGTNRLILVYSNVRIAESSLSGHNAQK